MMHAKSFCTHLPAKPSTFNHAPPISTRRKISIFFVTKRSLITSPLVGETTLLPLFTCEHTVFFGVGGLHGVAHVYVCVWKGIMGRWLFCWFVQDAVPQNGFVSRAEHSPFCSITKYSWGWWGRFIVLESVWSRPHSGGPAAVVLPMALLLVALFLMLVAMLLFTLKHPFRVRGGHIGGVGERIQSKQGGGTRRGLGRRSQEGAQRSLPSWIPPHIEPHPRYAPLNPSHGKFTSPFFHCTNMHLGPSESWFSRSPDLAPSKELPGLGGGARVVMPWWLRVHPF